MANNILVDYLSLRLALDYEHGHVGQEGAESSGCERHSEEELGSHSNHRLCATG